jgi:hypothetical protein
MLHKSGDHFRNGLRTYRNSYYLAFEILFQAGIFSAPAFVAASHSQSAADDLSGCHLQQNPLIEMEVQPRNCMCGLNVITITGSLLCS